MANVGRNWLLRYSSSRRAGLAAALWVTLIAASPVAAQPCTGDCSGDRSVTIDELITCVNIGLGAQPLAQCPQCNAGSDDDVDITDLVAAVSNSLTQCPPVATATPIPTASGPTATVTPTRVLPDLEFSGLTVVAPTPTGGCTNNPGEIPAMLRACATNIGNAPSAPFDISFNGTPLRVDMNLAPTEEVCLLFPFASGNASILIDSGMVIEELDESNNTGLALVSDLTPPPTCVATATITPTPGPTATSTPIGLGNCVVGGASQIDIKGALPLPPLPASGVIEIDCGSVGPNGKAPCTCTVQAPGFAALNIAGLFWACVKPAIAGVCPTGEIDCDGGNVLGVDIVGTRNTGTCTSQASCLASCATLCGGAASVFDSGCEGFCTDGANSACLTDAACGALGEGACDGPDGVGLGNICDCTCLDSAVGDASPAGTLQCQLAFNLTVEPLPGIGGACDGSDVSINVGDTCAPLSTQSAMAIINNGNNMPVQYPPGGANLLGAPADCSLLAANNASAITLQGAAIFYASTIGDLNALLTVDCQ